MDASQIDASAGLETAGTEAQIDKYAKDRDDEERWEYTTADCCGDFDAGDWLRGRLQNDDLEARVFLLPLSDHTDRVTLVLRVEDDDRTVAGTADLSPEQAIGLGRDLVECGVAQREAGDE